MESPREEFERRYQLKLTVRLGFGKDGDVWGTYRRTAVKFLERREPYVREREVYRLLALLGIKSILGHNVPELIRFDDELLAIEMTVVQPPYFLDFASAYAEGQEPDFPDEVWEEWHQRMSEEFGERWPMVQRLREELRDLIGVVLLDVNSRNITFDPARSDRPLP